MKRYIRIFNQCFKNALSYLLTYRMDFVMKLLIGIGWSLVAIAMVEVVFLHTNSFNGWSKGAMILMLFSFEFAIEIAQFAGRSIDELSEHIRKGSFDFLITKPVDSQFLAVFGKPDITNLMFFVAYQTPMVYLLIKYQVEIKLIYLPLYLLLILMANLLWLSIKTMGATLNFWWQRLNNINALLFVVIEAGKYPISIFPRMVQGLLVTVLPVAFMAMIPAQTLLGAVSLTGVAGSIIITGLFVTASRLLWKRAVKNYVSASS